MKRLMILFLIVCMVLCGCAESGTEQTVATNNNADTTAAAEQTTAAATTEATETTTVPETTVAATTEATVPVVQYRNPLNGSLCDTAHVARPYAVVLNNIEAAQPMCSLSYADFVFEILAEGGITRYLGVYEDVSELDHIGAVRSARPYLVNIAASFDAIFIHHGGSRDGYGEIGNLDVDDIDALGNGNCAFYRDQGRLNDGYALEHTSFVDGQDVLDEVEDLGYATERPEGVEYGFLFDDLSSAADGQSATELKAVFGRYGKTTNFTYDEVTGLYGSRQYGDDVYDGNTGEDVTYRNVLMITAETYTYQSDGVRMHITLVGEGSGYFACDGKVVPIRWSRESDHSPFVFTHEDGTPITLGVGNTYVAVTPLEGTLEY